MTQRKKQTQNKDTKTNNIYITKVEQNHLKNKSKHPNKKERNKHTLHRRKKNNKNKTNT